MTTIKELQQEVARLELKRLDLQDYRKHIPGYQERYEALQKEKEDYLKSIRPKFENCNEMIWEYKAEIKNLQEKNKLVIPDELKKWWKDYSIGVDLGYNGIKISWISEDKKWVIITNKGGTAGTGTPMGTGGYYYAATQHWLACTKLGRYLDRPGNHFQSIEGRLTKEAKQKLIDMIPEIEIEKPFLWTTKS